jgi:nitroreductase
MHMIWKHGAEEQTSVRYEDGLLFPGDLVEHPNPDMSLQDAILTRRTVRAYRPEPVPYELFQQLVETSMNAPTACDEQRWKIIYIDDPAMLQDLYERGSAAALTKAKQAFLITYNRYTDNLHYHDHVQSAAAFITTFSLVAHSAGVGSCWIGHLPNKREVSRIFGIHPKFEPIALVTFGFYRDRMKMRPRKRSAAQVVFKGRFMSEGLDFSKAKNVPLRILLRAIYYAIPAFLRRRLRKASLKYEKKFYNEIHD